MKVSKWEKGKVSKREREKGKVSKREKEKTEEMIHHEIKTKEEEEEVLMLSWIGDSSSWILAGMINRFIFFSCQIQLSFVSISFFLNSFLLYCRNFFLALSLDTSFWYSWYFPLLVSLNLSPGWLRCAQQMMMLATGWGETCQKGRRGNTDPSSLSFLHFHFWNRIKIFSSLSFSHSLLFSLILSLLHF